MTLIEGREALEPRILGKRTHELDHSHFDESGSDEEFLIANEGYPEDEESNNNRDFFSLPTLGLNYFNNLNLSLNLNLNLRNSPLWRIYENTSFTKPGFLSQYLGKHSDGVDSVLDINDHEISPETRGYFTLTNFLRRHGFQSSLEDEFSEEAILERIRFKELQKQAAAQARKFVDEGAENNLLSELQPKEHLDFFNSANLQENQGDREIHSAAAEVKVEEDKEESALLNEEVTLCETEGNVKEMTKHAVVTPLNPFYNRVEVSAWEYFKILLVTCTILPFRVLSMILVLTIALITVMVGMCGISFEETQSRPFPTWRKAFRWVLAHVIMRAFIFSSGFIWNVKEKGRRAKPEEAPIFVVGPHSSYFDAFVVILLGAPSVVAKLSTKDIPVFGRLVTLTQAVYVSRENKGSRKQTMEVLKNRAQGVYNGSGMPQIFIFPEGTCGNRSSLIKFKPGAFVPQVPVQPVLIRYPNKFDAVTWTFDGPPVLRSIWYALAQVYNNIEVEYLPVYVPNEEEKNDPNLYGDNVRKVMAKALRVPLSDYQFEDGSLLCNMRASKLVQKLRSIYRAKKALGLSGCSSESTAIFQHKNSNGDDYNWKFQQFQREFFHVSSAETTVPEVQAAFNLFKKEEEDEVADIRPYLILTCMLYEDKAMRAQDMISEMCQMYGLDFNKMTEPELKNLTEAVFETSEKEHRPIQISSSMTLLESKKSPYLPTDALRPRLSRFLEFTKLFADEVTERLPKTYPSRAERDKMPKRKLKSE